MGWASGFNAGANAVNSYKRNQIEAEEAERKKVLAEQADEEYKYQKAQRTNVNNAFNDVTTLQQDGVISSKGGLAQPSVQMLYAGNTGYGKGEGAVQEATGDYQREMARFRQASPDMAIGLPTYDAKKGVNKRDATELEIERGMGSLAAAQRDGAGLRASQANVKELKFNEGYGALAKQMVADKAQMDPKEFVAKYGAPVNSNGAIDGFATWDSTQNKIAYSTKDGVNFIEPDDLIAHNLAAYKLGNGKVDAGITMMMGQNEKTAGRVRQAVEDSRKAATLAGEMYFKQLSADNDAARTKNDAQRTANDGARTRAATRGQAVELVNDKGEAALFYLDKTDAKTGKVQMPEGYRFRNQKPGTEIVKQGESGAFTVVDTRTKTPLFRVGEDGSKLPAGNDPWADPKVKAKNGEQGIVRRLAEDDETGRVAYRYFDAQNPDSVPVNSPDEVLRDRERASRAMSQRGGGRSEPAATGLQPPSYGPVRGVAGPAVTNAVSSWNSQPRQRYVPGVGLVDAPPITGYSQK